MRQKTHAGTHNSTGPLSDAGPYEYDLPAARGGVGQPAPASQPVSKDSGRSWKSTLFVVLAAVGAAELEELSGLRLIYCYAILYCIVIVLSYWDQPKPRQGFLRWTLEVVGLFINFFIALVAVPQSL